MISPADTAYPVLSDGPSQSELAEAYTPDLFELKFAESRTREASPRIALLAMLKTFQRLGYFVKLADIPQVILRKIAQTGGYEGLPAGLDDYDQSTLRVRHMALVRSWTGVSAFDRQALKTVVKSCVDASRVREDLADIINIAIEELLRKRYELPGFTTLFRAARTARSTVNQSYYNQISQALSFESKARIDGLFDKPDQARQTPWDQVKNEPGAPTVKGVKRFLDNSGWLKEQCLDPAALAGVPIVKRQRFALEARALNASRMKELRPEKRYAFSVALLQRQRSRALDDGADMLIRLVRRMQNTANEKLKLLQAAHLQQSANLVAKLREVGLAFLSDASETHRLQSIGALLGPDVQDLLHRCEEHMALASGNYLRLLPQCYRHPRQALLALLENMPLSPTSQDRSVIAAVEFVLANHNSRSNTVSTAREGLDDAPLDLSFVSDAWWPLVSGSKARTVTAQVDRRMFELCVLFQVANDFKSGDLCIADSDRFRDYRLELLSWEQVGQELASYGEQAGIATEPKPFIAQLRKQLEDRGRATDKGFPDNRYLRFENGEPILTPVEAVPDPEGLDQALSCIRERLEPIEILDAFADTEYWLNWTRHFGPISGLETKLKRARSRYLLTVFCYGGPPDGLLTWFLQRTIIGVEAYLPPALSLAAVHYGRLNTAIIRARDNPYSLNLASTADTFYNGMPGLLHANYRLKRFDGSLWKQVREFYGSARNPLFHGHQLQADGLKYTEILDAVLKTYSMFVSIYKWIDWWCPQRFIMGNNAGGAVPISQMPTLPDGHPLADNSAGPT